MNRNYLFYMGILSSSLDSFPLFINISTYAPYFSVLFFCVYLFLHHSKNDSSFSKKEFLYFLIITFSYLFSFFMGTLVYDDIDGFLKFSVQLTIAVLLYKSFNCYFKKLPPKEYVQIFSRKFIVYTIPVLIIGIIEILLINKAKIYSSLVSFFSWRVTPERIQLISGEPSWGARLLLVLLAIIPLTGYNKSRQNLLTIISLILLFYTGSSLGILCMIIYYSVVYFRYKYIKYILLFSSVFIFSAPIVYNSLNDYTKNRLEALSQLKENNLETLAVEAGSGSIMARLGNPIIGLYVGIDNPITGVGGGYYYKYHYEYLTKYFPNALSIKNIYETGVTTKNLFSRIFAEMGILGFITLLWPLVWLLKNVIYKDRRMLGIYVCMILLTLNFDTLFHIYPLILFCFLLNYPQRQII